VILEMTGPSVRGEDASTRNRNGLVEDAEKAEAPA
jgi:hypothetical protein